MKLLHINTNYNVSTIYPNMVSAIQENESCDGKVYFPIEKSREISIKNNNVIMSKILKKTDRLFFFKRNIKLLQDIQNVVDLEQVNFILSYSLFSNGFLAESIFRKYNKPYIIIVQNTDLNLYFKKMVHLRWVGKRILNNAHSIVFLSKPYQEYTINNFFKIDEVENIMKKSFVIPFGIDDFWFENTPQIKHGILDKNIKLLYAGKINKNKNITTTIKACLSLMEKGYTVTFTIVGEVQNKRILKYLIKHDFVNYIPFVEKSKLIEIYRQNHVFVMPSIKESFGLVYAESISQGIPVIYTRNQGFDGHFQDGTVGYSVNCFDYEEIANRILDIIKNYDDITQKCLNSAKKFKWKKIASTYTKLFRTNNEIS